MIVEGLEEKRKKYSGTPVFDIEEMPAFVAGLLKKGRKTIHVLEFEDPGVIRKACKLDDSVPMENKRLIRLLAESRVSKTPGEVVVMRRIASQAHIETMKRVRPGMVENDVDALYHFFSKKIGGVNCTFQCFYPVASFGGSTSVLHYWAPHRGKDVVAKDGDFALLDSGVEWSCYGADITRTFPVNGKFTDRQKDIYNIVLAAHDAIFERCKPGTNTEDLHRLGMEIIGEGLLKLGFFLGIKDAKEAVEKDLVALFFPHGFGHMLGIDGHDVGGYPEGVQRINKPGFRSLRTRRPLQVNMITTDEPGIYFHPDTLVPALTNPTFGPYLNADLIKSYLDFGGIRIEDDVLITPLGGEYLTSVPRTVEAIEQLLAEGRAEHGDKWSI